MAFPPLKFENKTLKPIIDTVINASWEDQTAERVI